MRDQETGAGFDVINHSDADRWTGKEAKMRSSLLFIDQLRVQVGDIIRRHLQRFAQACKAALVFGLCFPRHIKMRLSYLLKRHL